MQSRKTTTALGYLGAALTGLTLGWAAQAEPTSALGDDGPPPTFEKLDIDGDKQISREEAKLERELFIHYDAFDTDDTNRLSPREYEKYKSY